MSHTQVLPHELPPSSRSEFHNGCSCQGFHKGPTNNNVNEQEEAHRQTDSLDDHTHTTEYRAVENFFLVGLVTTANNRRLRESLPRFPTFDSLTHSKTDNRKKMRKLSTTTDK